MKIITAILLLFTSTTLWASSFGSVSLKQGKVPVEYASLDGSHGLRDYVTLLEKENTLVDQVPSGSESIDIYELKTSPDLRMGGVIYRRPDGSHRLDRLKIDAPLSERIFASFHQEGSFLSLEGQVAQALWELCKKHGEPKPSGQVRYDFGSIVCNREIASGLARCTVWGL